jgi:hypothetical protein
METKRSPLRSRKDPELPQRKSRKFFKAENSRAFNPWLEKWAAPVLRRYSGMKNLLGSHPDDSVLPFVKTPDF